MTAAVCLALSLVTHAGPLAAQTGTPLTNEDVIKTVRAQLAPAIVLTTIDGSNATFDLSPSGLITLKDAGVPDQLIHGMQNRMRSLTSGASTDSSTRTAPEKSDLLADSRDPHTVLRMFKTMLVDASRAVYFGTPQMKAALGEDKGFALLGVSIVDDPTLADVVLNVSYTFAWDYPFALKHQNTSVVLLSGRGTGPFSGPLGASSVAGVLVKALKPFRTVTARTKADGRSE